MRIGNTDDINKSNQSDALISLLSPKNKKEMTRAEKWKNWWHYHKWYAVCGAVLLVIAIDLIGHSLGFFTKTPDLQVAYVGKYTLYPDTVSALQQTFTSLIDDYNGDGEILVQINQYIMNDEATDLETMQNQYASEVVLAGDISECKSYLFLLDDPGQFQQKYQLLAAPDGSCPDDADYSVEDKVILWSDCPLLAGQASTNSDESTEGQNAAATGDGQSAGESQSSPAETESTPTAAGTDEIPTGLYLGRRCFYTDQQTDNAEACSALWDSLYDSSLSGAH